MKLFGIPIFEPQRFDVKRLTAELQAVCDEYNASQSGYQVVMITDQKLVDEWLNSLVKQQEGKEDGTN